MTPLLPLRRGWEDLSAVHLLLQILVKLRDVHLQVSPQVGLVCWRWGFRMTTPHPRFPRCALLSDAAGRSTDQCPEATSWADASRTSAPKSRVDWFLPRTAARFPVLSCGSPHDCLRCVHAHAKHPRVPEFTKLSALSCRGASSTMWPPCGMAPPLRGSSQNISDKPCPQSLPDSRVPQPPLPLVLCVSDCDALHNAASPTQWEAALQDVAVVGIAPLQKRPRARSPLSASIMRPAGAAQIGDTHTHTHTTGICLVVRRLAPRTRLPTAK